MIKPKKHIVERTLELFIEGCNKADIPRMAAEVYPSDVTVISDVPYINDGNEYHVLDFYVPTELMSDPAIKAGKFKKVAMDIHGGGFVYGKKEINKCFNMTVASKSNTPVVSINYQLSPTVSIVAQLNEIRTAIEFLIREHGVEEIVIMGDSAGGYHALATWALLAELSIREEFKCSVEVSNINVSGLVLICPSACDESGFIYGIEEAFFGDEPSEKLPAYGRDLGKILEHVGAPVPPTVVITSDKDFLEKEGQYLRDRLKDAGCDVRFFDGVTKEGGNELFHVYVVGHPDWEESAEPLKLICELIAQ